MFNNKNLNLGVFGIIIVQIIILSTGLSKFFIVTNIDIKYILMTIVTCLFMFVIGELAKPIYIKLFKDYKEAK